MSKKLIFMFAIVSTFVLFMYSISNTNVNRELRYFRYDSSGLKGLHAQKAFENVLSTNRFTLTKTPSEADLIFLERFSDQHVFARIKALPTYSAKHLYTLVSVDQISSKSALYDLMRKNSTESELLSIFPRSYVTSDRDDVNKLEAYVEAGNPIILKKNVQQQKGCLITDSLDDIDLGEYAIAQELLQNPYTVSGRKINIRVYVMIQFDKLSNVRIHVYDDGFMYYTPREYIANTIDKDRNITTGYIDREVYKVNPLTLKDFKSMLGDAASGRLSRNILRCFKKLFDCITHDLRTIERTFEINKFIVMGADVAVDKQLNIKIMEINKGPDLQPKDNRDGNLKKKLLHDAFEIQGFANSTSDDKNARNGFIRL